MIHLKKFFFLAPAFALFVGASVSAVDWEWDWGKYKTHRFKKPVYTEIKRSIGNWVAAHVQDEFDYEFGCHQFRTDSGKSPEKIYCSVSYQAPHLGGLTFFTFNQDGSEATPVHNIDDFDELGGSTKGEKALRKLIKENQGKFIVWENVAVRILKFKNCISLGNASEPHGACVVLGDYGDQQGGPGQGYFSLNISIDDEGTSTFKAVKLAWD